MHKISLHQGNYTVVLNAYQINDKTLKLIYTSLYFAVLQDIFFIYLGPYYTNNDITKRQSAF